MSNHTNGSGNGHDPDHKDDKDKIVHFPSFAERKKKTAWRNVPAAKPAAVPFFNLKIIPIFTRVLLSTFLIVQIALMLMPNDLAEQIVFTFGFVPGYFTGKLTPFPLGAIVSPITHMFIHGGWMHLAFNSVMAVSLGVFFEREFGTRKTIIFFFVSGLCGVALYFAFNPFSTAPMIGASGGVSGLFGAMIMLLGKRGGLGHKMRSPWPLIIFWVLFLVIGGMVGGSNTAWQAHVGGFLGGIALLHLMHTGKIKL